jgi:hypothetical protein
MIFLFTIWSNIRIIKSRSMNGMVYSSHGKTRNANKILVVKPEDKVLLKRPRRM